MKTPQEAAREYAHDHIAERCKSTNCKEFDCRPFDRNVAGYHTRCRARYQEYRDGFLAGDAFGYRRGLEKAYRWISVGDELPKDQDDVLVLFCNGRKGIGSYVGNNEWAVIIANEYDSHDLKVLAWRHIERVKE
jgi:hypothetical protein